MELGKLTATRGLTDQQKADVLRVYPSAGDAGKTATLLNLQYSKVYSFLYSSGSTIPPKRVTPAIRARMVELYASGKSTWEIGAELGYLNVCVINHLKRAGVVLRSRSDAAKMYSVNRDYFAAIDTHTKAYVFGLIAADGNVSKDSFTLALQERDKALVEAVASEIGFTGPLGYRKPGRATWQGMWVLRVHDQEFCSHLRAIGIVERKTSQLQFPLLPLNLVPSFILGVLDGDGCVYIPKTGTRGYKVGFSGAHDMLAGIANVLRDNIGVKGDLRPGTGRGWALNYSATSGLSVAAWLYGKSRSSICMKRKRAKVDEIAGRLRASSRTWQHTRAVLDTLSPFPHAA